MRWAWVLLHDVHKPPEETFILDFSSIESIEPEPQGSLIMLKTGRKHLVRETKEALWERFTGTKV
ncbi:hypothetical protein LCGC14_2363790 [marine sediment metagenome]|uniref:Uncharacterized protein n=1 Tax=marine sediment metagenome TaxID=412755 RepID=A0A0F9C5Q4_9ZZZZ